MKSRSILAAGAALALGFAPLATAHPHVFVDTTLRLIVEDGHVVAVDVTWEYDDFLSLLIFEDMGLDRDGDGQLTTPELTRLKGFDLIEWPEGFEGDLFMWSNGEKIVLGHPQPTDIAVNDGRIVASHTRTVPQVAVAGLEVKQYDPTYYVAYTLTGVTTASGDCTADIAPYSRDAAEAALAEELSSMPEDVFEVMQLGHLYADTIRLTCSGSS
ncbi:MAG: DUF1007 family protein [Paracoccaceae bacterium]|nr:DUF1007 family protein [Paracoccaceae bacterium]